MTTTWGIAGAGQHPYTLRWLCSSVQSGGSQRGVQAMCCRTVSSSSYVLGIFDTLRSIYLKTYWSTQLKWWTDMDLDVALSSLDQSPESSLVDLRKLLCKDERDAGHALHCYVCSFSKAIKSFRQSGILDDLQALHLRRHVGRPRLDVLPFFFSSDVSI